MTKSFFKQAKRFSSGDKPKIDSIIAFSPTIFLTQQHLVPKARTFYRDKKVFFGEKAIVKSIQRHLIEVIFGVEKTAIHFIAPEDLISVELTESGEKIFGKINPLLLNAQKINLLTGVTKK